MENVYIFDLDNTLYSVPYFTNSLPSNFYDLLPKDVELRNLLLQLKKTYIFTNGNARHLELCLNKMGLRGCFINATYQELFKKKLKPLLYPYIISFYQFNLQHKNVFFFEDSLSNLRTAKHMEWNTIYINKQLPRDKPLFVDYMFNDIKTAIKFIGNVN